MEGAGTVVVVRRGSTWTLTSVDGASAADVSLAQLLLVVEGEVLQLPAPVRDVLQAAGAAPPALFEQHLAAALSEGAAEHDGEPLPDESPPLRRASFAALLVPGGLLAHGDGAWALLDAVDLALLDAVAGRTAVQDAADAAAATVLAAIEVDLHARLARLVDRRLLQVRAPSTRAARPGAETVVGEPRRLVPVKPPPELPVPEGHVPVWAPWDDKELPLGLAMVTAAAREACEREGLPFVVHPPLRSAEVLERARAHRGPAVLLCSDYQWTVDQHLALAADVRSDNPDVLVVHGGPATPKYEDDARRFFERHGDAVDVAIRGEGEVTFVEALRRLRVEGGELDRRSLEGIPGLTVRTAAGDVVRGEDRDRIADLDALPSPYLTGELDHISGLSGTVETNRGCPYGCTFCDWGSATSSRVRKFDLDRVEAELRWLADRGLVIWTIGDANFGIFPRDVEVAERVVKVKRDTGLPHGLAFCLAKNTTRHLVQIVDLLVGAGVTCHTSLSLQTRDPDTLAAIDRKNIRTEHYADLANAFRRKGLPLRADLMLGLPGQTVDSYRDDLQFLLDLEVGARTWPTQVLPNAPLNAPEYRAEHQVVVDEHGLLASTSSYTAEDREAMVALRLANAVGEHFGLLRHVLRHLQWDHGQPAAQVLQRLLDVTGAHPGRYPLVAWTLRWFDVQTMPPVAWPAFYAEVRRFVVDELQVPLDGEHGLAFDVVLRVQEALMPTLGRTLPDEVALAHDYVAYYEDATRWLWEDGAEAAPVRPLRSYRPGVLEVWGDPSGLYSLRLGSALGVRDELNISPFWLEEHWELDSPLTRHLAEVASNPAFRSVAERLRRIEVPVSLA